MNIKIRSINFDITPAIDEYVSKKISSLEKFLEVSEGTICEVEIGRTTKHHNSGDIFKAEINLTQPGSKQVYAVAEESDLYTAIDIVRDETERAIVSRKTKDTTLFRKGASKIKDLLKRVNFRKTN
jgi:putative sigma-54 modulation protein